MKLPYSRLENKDLETLFQQSSIRERHFFPRQVPSLFTVEKEKLNSYISQGSCYEDTVEKN